jgi:aldose 1-epimerase
VITLRHGGLSLGILPECGASITHFRDGDFPLLRETPAAAIAGLEGRDFAAFALVPYSNRIRNGEFTFAGEKYTLARDAEDPRHALHGTARFKTWELESQTAAGACCVFAYQPRPYDWPFPYLARQDFTLLEDRLRLEISLRNLHIAPAPAGIGLHPYFTRHGEALLQFAAPDLWAKDAADIPTHAQADAGKFDFSQARQIELEDLIDHAYGGWNGAASITYPRRGRRLTIRASSVFANLVVYTPEDRDYFAVEPVTHRPDAINPNGDPHDKSMAILQPGETLAGVIEIITAPGS